jgi:predicted transcriptional regulator
MNYCDAILGEMIEDGSFVLTRRMRRMKKANNFLLLFELVKPHETANNVYKITHKGRLAHTCGIEEYLKNCQEN